MKYSLFLNAVNAKFYPQNPNLKRNSFDLYAYATLAIKGDKFLKFISSNEMDEELKMRIF